MQLKFFALLRLSVSDGESAKQPTSIDLEELWINFSRVGKSEDMDSKKDCLFFIHSKPGTQRVLGEKMAAY